MNVNKVCVSQYDCLSICIWPRIHVPALEPVNIFCSRKQRSRRMLN